MNTFKRIRAMGRVRDELQQRVEAGMDPEQAACEAVDAVKNEFVAAGDPKSAIDWAALLPMIMQLITMLLPLITKKP
jgi:hypothetical protein